MQSGTVDEEGLGFDMEGPEPTPGSHSSHFTPPTVESLALRAPMPARRRRRWEGQQRVTDDDAHRREPTQAPGWRVP